MYVDAKYFQGYDSAYAIGAIRDQLARKGVALVDTPHLADAILSIRAGALSTDDQSLLIGVPQLQFPFLPAGTSITVPEIALFKTFEARGVAKFAMTGYDAKTGKLISTSDPQFGFSHETNHTVLLFFSWRTGDIHSNGMPTNPLSVGTLGGMFNPSEDKPSIAAGQLKGKATVASSSRLTED